MRILVTWGTKMGGTEGIARIIGDELERAGFDVVVESAAKIDEVRGFDAAIVGGALYANRWHHDTRRFVARNVGALRRIPVWLFSSGPLDESAERGELPTPTQAAVLADRIGAVGHVMFGGRLAAEAKGFPAQAMAKTLSGDWRNPERIRAWTAEVARLLPTARPRAASDPPGRAAHRVVTHAVAGWAMCAIVMMGLLRIASTGVAIALHAIAAPIIFTVVAIHYFRVRGARAELPTALAMTAIVALLDAVVISGLLVGSFEMFASFAGTWLPLSLIFLVTWLVGFVFSTMPWPKKATKPAGGTNAAASA